MNQPIDAIYDNGVLRPLTPLSLPDKTHVKVTVQTQPHEAGSAELQDKWEQRVVALAKDCGVSLPDSAVASEGLYE